jgi:hypothetical protein
MVNGNEAEVDESLDPGTGVVGVKPPDPPKVQAPPKPPEPARSGAKRFQCEQLKGGKKITIGNSVVQADANGVIEVPENVAVKLRTIPCYKEV